MAEDKKPEKKEDKKPTRSEKRYGGGPKIAAKEDMGEGVDREEAAPEPSRAKDDETAPETSPEAGTDGIPVQHASERAELHQQHQANLSQIHHRHEREHAARVAGQHAEDHEAMSDRHHAEVRSAHTMHERSMREMSKRHLGAVEDKGKTGTEPKK